MFQFKPHSEYPQYYKECELTGILYYLPSKKRNYTGSYFMEEYKNQYNKTYYEDEPNLRNLAKDRLKQLSIYNLNRTGNLLEIGCAAGFFLDEASKLGYTTKGIDISEKEVEFARSILKLDVEHISFLEFTTEKKFDVVCAFFVIEHFKDQEEFFKKILSLITEDGFLFLAIPSIHGPTYRTNPTEWFKTHPEDHFVDYSPSSIRNVLKYFNMEVVWNKPMSYHPVRDLGWRNKFPFSAFYKQLANLTSYGDTLQIIAKRIKK